MNLAVAVIMTTLLLGFTMLVQGIEFLLISRKKYFLTIWSYQNLSTDLNKKLPLPAKLNEMLFGDFSFKVIVVAHILAALAALLFAPFYFLCVLTLTHFLICIRFRGTFNGGSDMMIFVLLTGAIIANSSASVHMQKLGLLYIAVHAIFSYLKAGWVKIKNKEWRSGKALPIFLSQSLFTDIQKMAIWMDSRPRLALGLCWLTIFFELGIVSLPFLGFNLLLYFAAAVLFHFIIYINFGLNRFFWAWLSAWPAIFYFMTSPM